MLERMAAQFKLEIDTRPPRIPYRETITAKAEGFHRHKKQTGGAGQFGEVSLRVEPLPRGAGFEFVDADQGRRDSAPVHAGRAEGRRAGARHRRDRRLSAAGRARRSSTTASTIRSTRRKSRSSPRARRRSSTRSRRRARSCWSRSSASRSSVPRRNTGDIAGDLSSRRGQVTGTHGLAARRASRSTASRRWSSSRATRRG